MRISLQICQKSERGEMKGLSGANALYHIENTYTQPIYILLIILNQNYSIIKNEIVLHWQHITIMAATDNLEPV